MTSSIIAASASCALGSQLDTCVESLKNGLVQCSELQLTNLEDPVSAPYFAMPNPQNIPAHELMYQSTQTVLEDAIKQSGLSETQLQRTGLFWGSSSFTVSDSEKRYFGEANRSDVYALPMPIVGYNKLPEKLAKQFGLSNCVHSYATACTSSANAMLYADMFLSRGDIDHAIVVGSEFYNAATVLGFFGLELLSPKKQILPFDDRRDGLILGEGCAALVLSKNIVSGVQFLGGASNTDSFSLTAANSDGSTIAGVMNQALTKAGKSVDQVDAIKVHGTASLLNDEAEAAGLQRVFKEMPSVFALKPYIGHTLGACGAVEMALVFGAAVKGFVPSNPGIAANDSDLGLRLNQQNIPIKQGTFLLNYFAFGGNNTSLVFEYGA